MAHIHFSVLAPVPRQHLESAVDICRKTGHVCFGSDKWELFRELDARRQDDDVPVLIYASHNEDLADWGFVVAWRGIYIGSLEDTEAKYAEETAGHRPPTTQQYRADNAAGWGVFWKVKNLVELPDSERREIREFQSFRTGRDRDNAAPRGPEIIKRPPWI